ncbi:MAG: hypothetical protein ACTSQ8_19925 [Candidatus Helarchaeota archaeon]
MNKFTAILPGEAREYQRFYWHVDWDDTPRYFVRLVGVKLDKDGVRPVYLPFISIERRPGQLIINFQLDRWKTLAFMFDRFGIHKSWVDLKKEYDEQSDM